MGLDKLNIISVGKPPAAPIRKTTSEWTRCDRWGHVKCRLTAFRLKYTVEPGLYSIGNPDRNADVFASANYKLSFDHLRRGLSGMNAWILVLDTKGINVWCAAGKGTFGTEELVKRIKEAGLDNVVEHRRIILPQLAGPGVNAKAVLKACGFRVAFGPVSASDISAYMSAGYEKSAAMRTVKFALMDRLVLTPMEINPAMSKFPIFAVIVLLIFGLNPSGIIFRDAWHGGMPFVLLGLIAVFSGAFLTPVLLPFVPFRSFAIKGWLMGVLTVFLSLQLIPGEGILIRTVEYLFFPLLSSYIALQFTGSTAFTGMSGVKKELKIGIPVYIISAVLSFLLLIVYKLKTWEVL